MLRFSALPFLSLVIPVALALSAEDKDRLVRATEARTPEEEQKGFRLPQGFSVQRFADESLLGGKPINMAFDARGRLWVSSTREYPFAVPKDRWSDPQGTRAKGSKDAIRILEDTDGDGAADKVTVFADELNIPTGVLPYKNGCIAWSIPNLWYFEDTNGDGKCDNRRILFGPLGYERDTHGMISSLRLGLDGWVYATHGFSNTSHFEVRPENLKPEDRNQKPDTLDITSGSVFRFQPDGSRVELWTSGQVNPFGLCWDSWGNLYSADCHSNPITQLIRGAEYPQFGKPAGPLGFGPVMCDHAHGSTGLCGIVYLDGGVWGPEWDDHMFVGNCVTSRVNHDTITFTGSTPKANEAPDFLTSDDPWFRPVDLQLGPDGALYVADFYNRIIGHYEVPLDHPGRDRERGRIWRVVREGYTGRLTDADVTTLPDKRLADVAIASVNLTRRYLAVGEMNARHLPEDVLADSIARGTTSEFGRGKDKSTFTRRYVCSRMAGEWRPDRIPTILAWLRETPSADASLRHALNIALRNVLELRGGYEALRRAAGDAQDLELIRLSFAVPTADAANWMLERISKGEIGQGSGLSSAEFAVALAHIARHLPADRDAELVSLAQEHFADDLDTQIELLAAIRGSRIESGGFTTNADALSAWTAELTTKLLASLRSQPADSWVTVTPPTGANPNPWRPQSRKCADGEHRTLIDSHVIPGTEKLTGTLRSATFELPEKLSFWIAGHRGFPATEPHEKNFISLVGADSGKELARAFPPRNDVAQPVTWTFAPTKEGNAVEKRAIIEIADGDTASAYAWIAVGGFEPAVVAIPDDPLRLDTRVRHLAEWSASASASSEAVAWLTKLPDKAGFTPETRDALAAFLAKRSSEPAASLLAPLAHDAELAPVVFVTLQSTAPAGEELAKAFRTLPFRTQARLAASLAGSVEGATKLFQVAPAAVLAEPLVSSKLTALNDGATTKRLKELTSSLPPQSEALNRLIAARLASYDPAKADAARGQELFTTVCSICHRIGVRGNLVGPQLDGIGARGPERLLEDILDPNRAVDPAFRLHMVKRKDGTLYAGLQRREEGEGVVFTDATAQEIRIPKADIAGNEESPLSLMPPGLGDVLTEQQLHDLMAYLLARR